MRTARNIKRRRTVPAHCSLRRTIKRAVKGIKRTLPPVGTLQNMHRASALPKREIIDIITSAPPPCERQVHCGPKIAGTTYSGDRRKDSMEAADHFSVCRAALSFVKDAGDPAL